MAPIMSGTVENSLQKSGIIFSLYSNKFCKIFHCGIISKVQRKSLMPCIVLEMGIGYRVSFVTTKVAEASKQLLCAWFFFFHAFPQVLGNSSSFWKLAASAFFWFLQAMTHLQRLEMHWESALCVTHFFFRCALIFSPLAELLRSPIKYFLL